MAIAMNAKNMRAPLIDFSAPDYRSYLRPAVDQDNTTLWLALAIFAAMVMGYAGLAYHISSVEAGAEPSPVVVLR